jgi:hypothetical protein
MMSATALRRSIRADGRGMTAAFGGGQFDLGQAAPPIDRAGAKANRRESLRGIETKKGMDHDEYPVLCGARISGSVTLPANTR